MSKWIQQSFFKGRGQNDKKKKKTHEEMLNIPGCKGNANQNHVLIFYLSPVRMTIIKNTNNNKCWWGCGEKEALIQCWWVCKLVQPYCGKQYEGSSKK
jgi:hypothetical protein